MLSHINLKTVYKGLLKCRSSTWNTKRQPICK